MTMFDEISRLPTIMSGSVGSELEVHLHLEERFASAYIRRIASSVPSATASIQLRSPTLVRSALLWYEICTNLEIPRNVESRIFTISSLNKSQKPTTENNKSVVFVVSIFLHYGLGNAQNISLKKWILTLMTEDHAIIDDVRTLNKSRVISCWSKFKAILQHEKTLRNLVCLHQASCVKN